MHEHYLNSGYPKVQSRAHPPSRPERQELKIIAVEVNTGCAATIKKPFRNELLRVLPKARVPADGPSIDQDLYPRRNHVPINGAVSHGEVWCKQRRHRLEFVCHPEMCYSLPQLVVYPSGEACA
ncbi:LOW QUALITY PROTEIN: hypothetical protein U9M48_001195 [Paspalum notatum var. saurae]|uniref:Uncharacterized protein n=1 Tax=Paspalum notatum var. saurae TaxID=547442 RepID=A0AAQ3PG22_PASNO